jgi:hypothetical protein
MFDDGPEAVKQHTKTQLRVRHAINGPILGAYNWPNVAIASVETGDRVCGRLCFEIYRHLALHGRLKNF